MDVASVLGATTTGSSGKTKTQEDMDNFIGTREDFLTILLAQLKHQDPLDPMEGTEFIDSITRLSSVEQAVNQNLNLEKIVGLLEGQGQEFGNPVSYLDKGVEFASSQVELKNGIASFAYELDRNMDEVFISVENDVGEVIYSGKGTKKLGRNEIVWDGLEKEGNLMADGTFTVKVSAKAPQSTQFYPVPTTTKGVVTGADFNDGAVVLKVGSLSVPMDEIIAVRSLETN